MKLEKENMQLAFKFLKLCPCASLTDKVFQLWKTIQNSNGVAIIGETCSGKSTIIRLLNKFLEINDDTSLKVSTLNPNIYT